MQEQIVKSPPEEGDDLNENLQDSLNEVVLNDLKPLTAAIAIFYVAYITYEIFVLPEFALIPVIVVDISLICIFLGMRWALNHRKIPTKYANSCTFITGAVILADSIVMFTLIRDPFFTNYAVIVVAGIAYFMLSFRWWALSVSIYVAAWVPVSWLVTPVDDFADACFVIFGAVILSFTIQLTRLRTYRRIEQMRRRETRQNRKLEQALMSAEKEFLKRRRTQQEKEQLEGRLHHTKKMEAVGRLAGGVAHDMNNILSAIMGSASVLDDEIKGDSSVREDVDNILSACGKGRDLTRDLLGFARKGKYKKERISLNTVVDKVRALLNRTLPKKIVIEYFLENGLRNIEGDPSQIEYVLMNICLNSADAMEDQGRLVISTRNVEFDSLTDPRWSGLEPGRYVELKVSDTGKGIDSEVLTQVFEPFFTTKPKGKGTGLGLSMVYGTIHNHKGHVIIDSKPNKGCAVTFMLPSIDGHPLGVVSEQEERTATQQGSGGILLVDDEQLVRTSSERLLARLGYTIFVAENGRAAVEMFERHKVEISLVLMDLVMPEMDGYEAYYKLKKMDPEIKILLCSGFSKDEKVNTLLADGAVGFLPKPFNLHVLSEHVAKAIR
ncbi:MAG: response regulator [Proteobacteria bacterium]|nr:response regulator [Pseudomonadota bacterium]